ASRPRPSTREGGAGVSREDILGEDTSLTRSVATVDSHNCRVTFEVKGSSLCAYTELPDTWTARLIFNGDSVPEAGALDAYLLSYRNHLISVEALAQALRKDLNATEVIVTMP